MTELNIHTKGYRVLVKPDEIEETSEGGIILVQDRKLERAGQVRGTLVQVGELAWSESDKPWAEVGDWVLYARYAGMTLDDPITGEQYHVMNDEDIIAVLDRPTKED